MSRKSFLHLILDISIVVGRAIIVTDYTSVMDEWGYQKLLTCCDLINKPL